MSSDADAPLRLHQLKRADGSVHEHRRVHLLPGCPALTDSDPTRRSSFDIATWTALLDHPDSRPCRMCALEQATSALLTQHGDVTVVFSGADPATGRAASQSGQARLVEIASRAALAPLGTADGPVLCAKLTAAAAVWLSVNFWVSVTRSDLPGTAAVELGWQLIADRQLASFDRTKTSLDAHESVWQLARALT